MTTTETGSTELLPCPFCGGAQSQLQINTYADMSWVACPSCGLEAPPETGVSAEAAVAYWNTRPLRNAQSEAVAWRELVQEAIDLLAERKHGNPARSPGHNARLMLQDALALTHPAPPLAVTDEMVERALRAYFPGDEYVLHKGVSDGVNELVDEHMRAALTAALEAK